MGFELFHVEKLKDMKKLITDFRNCFAEAPKKCQIRKHCSWKLEIWYLMASSKSDIWVQKTQYLLWSHWDNQRILQKKYRRCQRLCTNINPKCFTLEIFEFMVVYFPITQHKKWVFQFILTDIEWKQWEQSFSLSLKLIKRVRHLNVNLSAGSCPVQTFYCIEIISKT